MSVGELADRRQTAAGSQQPLIHPAAQPADDPFDQGRAGIIGSRQAVKRRFLTQDISRYRNIKCHGHHPRPIRFYPPIQND